LINGTMFEGVLPIFFILMIYQCIFDLVLLIIDFTTHIMVQQKPF